MTRFSFLPEIVEVSAAVARLRDIERRELDLRRELGQIEQLRRDLTRKIADNRRSIRGLSLDEFGLLSVDLGDDAEDILGAESSTTHRR